MTWSEISYMSDCLIEDFKCFRNIVLDKVTKENRISTVGNCNATAETHNRKFGTAMVAGQLDFLASFELSSCLSNPLNFIALLPHFFLSL